MRPHVPLRAFSEVLRDTELRAQFARDCIPRFIIEKSCVANWPRKVWERSRLPLPALATVRAP